MSQTPDPSTGPPYINKVNAMLGGQPTIPLDIPICAVLLAFYVLGAIGNITIYQFNRRHHHKFLMSWAMFSFCMARIATFVLRIVWATRPTNASIVIATQILSAAGVLVAYIVVLLLSLRIFRATHPELGWDKGLRVACKTLYGLLFVAFVLTISFAIESFYTLDMHIKIISLWMSRASSLVMLLFNLASLVILCLSTFFPRASPPENFGTGSLREKTAILSTMMFFVLFIIGFRFGTAWTAARPASNPAWFDSKPAFYVIEFGLEIVVIYTLLLTRFDRMFWVPDGSKKSGDYHLWRGYQQEIEGRELSGPKEEGGFELKTNNVDEV